MTPHAFILVGFFAFVLGSVTLIGYLVTRRQEKTEDLPTDWKGQTTLTSPDEPDGIDPQALAIALFTWFGGLLPASEASRAKLERRLRYAGYRGPSPYSLYFGLKVSTALGLGVTFCVLAIWLQQDASPGFAALVCGLGLGFLVPERLLDSRISSRNGKLRRSLPPALDLVVMSLEAGQSIDQALLAASRGLRVLMPDLSSEFAQTHVEARISNGRADAIQAMADRNSEPELKKLCQLLIDSDRFGSSLAPTLRQHSKFLRIRFRQRAQESARKLTVKLVFPLFFLIFPAILVVTLAPAVLSFRKYFNAF